MGYTWSVSVVDIDAQAIHVRDSKAECSEFEDEDAEDGHHGNRNGPWVDCPFTGQAFAFELFYCWCQSAFALMRQSPLEVSALALARTDG